MLLLIPVRELNVKLEYLSPSFFFLKYGLESAIVSALEDLGESPSTEFQDREDSYSSFILSQLERHFDGLEESNSLPSNWQTIYDAVKVATIIVKEEVSSELVNLLGNRPHRVLYVRRLSKFDCLLNITY